MSTKLPLVGGVRMTRPSKNAGFGGKFAPIRR
jgi:hypothetical protein